MPFKLSGEGLVGNLKFLRTGNLEERTFLVRTSVGLFLQGTLAYYHHSSLLIIAVYLTYSLFQNSFN